MKTTRNRKNKLVMVGTTSALATLALVTLGALPASAHGQAKAPVSRALGCLIQDDNEHPVTYEGCKKYLEKGKEHGEGDSTNPIYEWSAIQITDVRVGLSPKDFEPQYRSVLKDESLCSAGGAAAPKGGKNSAFAGLDAPTADWPITNVKSGGTFEFEYLASQVHNPYEFTYYVTKDGFDPSKTLTWDDLEPIPFFKASAVLAENKNPGVGETSNSDHLDPWGNQIGIDKDGKPILPTIEAGTPSEQNLDQISGMPTGGLFKFKGVLPDKKDHHVIFTTWQGLVKTDGAVQSSEAFVSCADVNFS